MEQYIIKGGNPLVGDVTISGAKNAALGILAASIMTDDDVVIDNLPDVRDINVLLEAIQEIGARVDRIDRHTVKINACNIKEVSVDDEYIRGNPTDGVYASIKAAYHYETPKRHALTLPQEQAFLSFIKHTPKYLHWLPLFVFLLGTGCRISEAIGLCWEDVDFENGTITIRHNLVYHQDQAGKCYFTLSKPKTKAGERTLPLINEVRDVLLQEKAHQDELGMTCQYQIEELNNFVFLNRFGSVQNPQAVNRAIARIIRDYNERELDLAEKEKREVQLLPPFSCHNLRHTYCTRLCEVETNIKLIQELMGHADIKTTMQIYAEVTQQAKADAGVRLSGNLGIAI